MLSLRLGRKVVGSISFVLERLLIRSGKAADHELPLFIKHPGLLPILHEEGRGPSTFVHQSLVFPNTVPVLQIEQRIAP